MAVPEVLDWANVSGFRYIRPKRAELIDDLTVEHFWRRLRMTQYRLDTLKNEHIFAVSAEKDDELFDGQLSAACTLRSI